MRPATLARLHAAAFDRARPWSTEEFAALLAQPHCFAIGDRRGFALARAVAGEAELLTIATHPDHRRQGRARSLMLAWQAEARARGAAHAFLEVAADNGPAIALYRACGFAPGGRRPGYYRQAGRNPVDAVLMVRRFATEPPPNPGAAA